MQNTPAAKTAGVKLWIKEIAPNKTVRGVKLQ